AVMRGADEDMHLDVLAVRREIGTLDLADVDAAEIDQRALGERRQPIGKKGEAATGRGRAQYRRLLEPDELASRLARSGLHLDVGPRYQRVQRRDAGHR